MHGGDKLLNAAYPDKFRNWASTRVQRAGIDVVLGDMVENVEPSNGSVSTKNGKSIKADLVVGTLSLSLT